MEGTNCEKDLQKLFVNPFFSISSAKKHKKIQDSVKNDKKPLVFFLRFFIIKNKISISGVF